jgi:hypothetical protein
MNPYKSIDLRALVDLTPPKQIQENYDAQNAQTQKDHEQFILKLKENICLYCNKSLDTFDETKFCLHWFTYPTGIRKRNFDHFLKQPLSFSSLECYFRWLANAENPLVQINDLEHENPTNTLVATTIRFRNIEWSFSCSNSDYEGHKDSSFGNKPHYHLQMLVDNNPFIGYNDFHIEFTNYDLWIFETKRQIPECNSSKPHFGSGQSLIDNPEVQELLIKRGRVAENEETALFMRKIEIKLPKDEKSGNLYREAVIESNETKVPLDIILKRVLPDVEVSVKKTLGKGALKKKRRSKTR